jgi:hypothetical protein
MASTLADLQELPATMGYLRDEGVFSVVNLTRQYVWV